MTDPGVDLVVVEAALEHMKEGGLVQVVEVGYVVQVQRMSGIVRVKLLKVESNGFTACWGKEEWRRGGGACVSSLVIYL